MRNSSRDLKGSVGIAMLDDVERRAGVESGDVAQEVLARGVELDAHAVHAGDDDIVEGTLQGVLVHVVLVLADTDRLRVELHEFGQRIHEAASDGDGASHGDVVVREFFAGGLGGGVDRRAGFVDDDDIHGGRKLDLADEGFRLTRGGAVADRDGLDVVLLHQSVKNLGGLDLLAGAFFGVDDLVFQQLSLAIHCHDLAAGAEAGVDRQRGLLAERRGKQELAEVIGEDADGFLVGLLLVKRARLGLHAEAQQTLVAILDGQLHLFGCGGFVF